MSDIVERLRERHAADKAGTGNFPMSIVLEAANEITALRARIAQLEASIADEREDAARAMQEACAKVADRLGGVRGPHDAVSLSNRAQHTRARTIAAAIRAGVGDEA